MSSYDSYERRRRQFNPPSSRGNSSWGHWLPLAITVTVAAGGLAAWIWKERKDNDEDDYHSGPPGSGPPPPGYGPDTQGPPSVYGPPLSDYQGPPPSNVPGGFGGPPPGQTPYSGPPPSQAPYSGPPEQREVEDASIMGRMSGALRRTPSPQQIFDGASKRVVAGVSAAGAAVTGALTSITEEDRPGYEDHRSWSEEADSQSGGKSSRASKRGPDMVDNEGSSISRASQATVKKGGKRKSVAIVVSSVTDYEHDDDAGYHQEHASILSHLPEHLDSDSRIFVFIYAPDLMEHPLAKNGEDGKPSNSMASSYSNISHGDAQSPPKISTNPDAPKSKMFETLYSQAQAIVDKDTMIMPFTTATGYISMLRHLGPETVYLQASLAGKGGEHITQVKSWVDQIVIVVGDDSGHGGLADSEDEHGASADKWWMDDPRIGLGKGVEVVDGLRVGEDFRRRVAGHD